MAWLIYDNIILGAGIGHTYGCYNFPYYLAKKYNLTLAMPNTSPGCPGFRPNESGIFEKFFGLDDTSGLRLQLLNNNDIEKVIIPNSGDVHDYEVFLTNYDIKDDTCFHIRAEEYSIQRNAYYDFSLTRKELSDRYKKARYYEPCVNWLDDECINVAVHIRRGNVLIHEHLRKHRAAPDQGFIDHFNKIKSQTNKPIRLNIYTEGREGKYYNENNIETDIVSLFNHDNTKLYMSLDIKTTIDNMARSDIIIKDRSGFSMIAALFYEPKLYYVPNISGY
jgi:hypothetical protein